VLFEMLSGRRAFPGATILEIFTSVLRGAVDWQALPADVPRQVRLLMERCLEHEAANRPFLSEHDRYLNSVHSDARFRPLMERARREWERFEV
jgi:hypothetical protein